MNNLSCLNHYLHGAPDSQGLLKSKPEDFIVKEDLGFELTGEGEHIFVLIQKCNANTLFVAETLAKHLKLSPKLITHAGLKDRHAVTEQWFGIHLPGKETPDLLHLIHPEFTVLKQIRHHKKLKIGALAGNHFEIVLRDITNLAAIEARLPLIQALGVPNYFGEQRFGSDHANLEKVIAWSKGLIRPPDRARKSFFLSAGRSYFFNQIVSQRILNQTFTIPLVGDQMQFSEGNAYFTASIDAIEDIQTRFNQQLLRITAPLIGRSPWTSLNLSDMTPIERFEYDIVMQDPLLFALLEKETETQRRAISVMPRNFIWSWTDDKTLRLQFYLPSGAYATSVIREIINPPNI